VSKRDLGFQRLLDESAIRRLLNLYSRAIDSKDRKLLASLFTRDAVVEYGVYNGPVAGFLDYVAGGEHPSLEWMHHLGTQIIDLDGDTASAETYCLAFSREASGGSAAPETAHRLRYLDRLECHAGAWLIAHRRVVPSPAPA